MSAIFSVQNLQTFLRRKNLRPPSRGGPPGPDRPPPPPPPNRGRSPPERGPSPDGRDGRSLTGAAAFVSSVISLLPKSLSCCWSFRCRRFCGGRFFHRRRGLCAHLLLGVTQLLNLLQPLLLFVDAH